MNLDFLQSTPLLYFGVTWTIQATYSACASARAVEFNGFLTPFTFQGVTEQKNLTWDISATIHMVQG